MGTPAGRTVEARCSFCGKGQDKVQLLIAGPGKPTTVYICDRCVELCHEVVLETPSKANRR